MSHLSFDFMSLYFRIRDFFSPPINTLEKRAFVLDGTFSIIDAALEVIQSRQQSLSVRQEKYLQRTAIHQLYRKFRKEPALVITVI